MEPILTVAIAVVALIVGALLTWLWRGRELATKLAPLNAELVVLRDARSQLKQSSDRNLELEKALSAAQSRADRYDGIDAELTGARQKITELSARKASLESELSASTKAHAQQVEQLTALRQDVQDRFKLLASEVLKTSNDDFLQRAEEVFRNQKELTANEIDTRSKTISDLIKPIGDSLQAYDAALQTIEKARIDGFAGINSALLDVNRRQEEVRSATSTLVNALRASPKTRGRWGEETLRRVMELSGMVEHCDFETEKHFRGDDESLRPDAVISIAGGRTIVVDAKAPVSAYLDAIEASSEDEREMLLKRHAQQLRERLTNLSRKSYWEKFQGSPDCVVMFVPGDNFVAAAFERDQTLFEDGIKNRVLVCTPTTFIALAKAISYGWRQERLAESATEVAKLGKEMYGRLVTLGGHIFQLGKHLKDATKKYNDFVGSLESNVLPQARRFNDLGVEGTAEPIAEIPQVDTIIRFPQSNRDLFLPLEGGGNREST